MRPHIDDFPKSFPPVPTEVVRQMEPIVPGAGRTEERSVVEVTWCRNTESRMLVHINGIEVTDHGTFNDYWLFGLSCGTRKSWYGGFRPLRRPFLPRFRDDARATAPRWRLRAA